MNIKTYKDRHGQWRALVTKDNGMRIWTLPSDRHPDDDEEQAEGMAILSAQVAAFRRADEAGATEGDWVEIDVPITCSSRLVPRNGGDPYLMQNRAHYATKGN